MEKDIDKKVKEIEKEAKESEDPELYKARLVSKLEKKVAEDQGWREG